MNAETARKIFADAVTWAKREYAQLKRTRLLGSRRFSTIVGQALKVAYARARREAARLAEAAAVLAAMQPAKADTPEMAKARAQLMTIEAAERPSPRERAEAAELRRFLMAA